MGGWKSDTFAFYLRNDDRVLASVGKGMLNSTGLLSQLLRQSERDMLKKTERKEGGAGGKGELSFQLQKNRSPNEEPHFVDTRWHGWRSGESRDWRRGASTERNKIEDGVAREEPIEEQGGKRAE